jgi:predicted DsbA family dithiol-disulfide isomerase
LINNKIRHSRNFATIAEASGLDKQESLNVINDKNAYANDVRIDEATFD